MKVVIFEFGMPVYLIQNILMNIYPWCFLVFCDSTNLPSHAYEAGLATNLPQSLKTCFDTAAFILKNPRIPMVAEAFYDGSNAIVVAFDINVQCPRECSKIFQDIKVMCAFLFIFAIEKFKEFVNLSYHKI